MTTKKPSDKTTISWTNWRGKEETRTINFVIDVREFRGTPGYSMLVVAANTNLSAPDIEKFLSVEARELPLVERTLTWIKRRRWLFQLPGADNHKDPLSDSDGKHAKACSIMAKNPKLSLRDLVLLLKKHGIKRSREWCRKHRGETAV
jgi:hypothetical protein